MSSKIENPGNERYVVYFGRAHVDDHLTGVACRGRLKVGRAKFVTALMRGRNQPGIDFRVYAEIVVGNNEETKDLENIAADVLKTRHSSGSQGQRELYDVKDDEIADFVDRIVNRAKASFYPINILSIDTYI